MKSSRRSLQQSSDAKPKRLSNEEVKKIQELKGQGKANTEIAKELEVEEGTIRHHIRKLENFPIYESDSPTLELTEPPNVIKAPVKFQRPEPLPDDEDEDEEDLDIEAPDDEKKVYRVVKKEPSLSGDHYIRYIPLQLGRI